MKAVAGIAGRVVVKVAKKYGIPAVRAGCRYLEREIEAGHIKTSYAGLQEPVTMSNPLVRCLQNVERSGRKLTHAAVVKCVAQVKRSR